MIIYVKAKTKSKEQKIKKLGGSRYLVCLKSAPEKNKANIELINFLSKHFGIPAGKIKIKSGLASKNKVVGMM